MIKDVEEFGTKLDVLGFSDAEILEDREIPVGDRGPTPILRPALPNCWTGELGSGITWAKAAAFSHAPTVFGPAFGF